MKGENITWVRPVLAVIAVLGINIGFFYGRISSDAYMGVMGVIVTWWFRSRDEEKRNGQ